MLLTPEQVSNIKLIPNGESKESKKYTTNLNGKTYYVLHSNDKYYISRRPQAFSAKWYTMEQFQKTIDPENKFVRQTRDDKTKSGNTMIELIKDEVKYVAIITEEGKEYVSKENQIII